MGFRVYVVRHGTSKANIPEHCGKNVFEKWSRAFMHDPPLDAIGIANSTNFAQLHPNANQTYVCCSSLIRPMMTALLMFPDQEVIYVQPWIKEVGGTVNNMPLIQIQSQCDAIDAILGRGASRRLDFRHVQNLPGGRIISHPSSFWKLVGKQQPFLNAIRQRGANIVIVAHGKMIREELLKPNAIESACDWFDDRLSASCIYEGNPNYKMKNNEIWKREYEFLHPDKVLPMTNSKWVKVFPGFPITCS